MIYVILIVFILFIVNYVWNVIAWSFNTDRWGVYTDGNGIERFKSNKHIVNYQRDLEGYYILKDLKTGKTLINITNETAKWYKQKMMSAERSVYLAMCEGNGWAKSINPNLKGNRYRDIKTDRYYVGRRYEHGNSVGYFYMDMSTYKFVKPMDCAYYSGGKKYNIRTDVYKTLMQIRNKEVDNIMKNGGKVGKYHLYLNDYVWNEDYVFEDTNKFNQEEVRRF